MPDHRCGPRVGRIKDTAGLSPFATRLEALRLQAGLTLAQLGERSGLCERALILLRQGRNGPTWGTVLKLCRTLNVTPNDFL